MRHLLLIFGLVASLSSLTALLGSSPAYALDKGLRPSQEHPLKAEYGVNPFKTQFLEPNQITQLTLTLKLPKEYKAYEEQFKIAVADSSGFKIGKMKVSPIHDFFDDFSKKRRRGMIGEGTLKALIEAPGKLQPEGRLRLKLTYQACTKTFCLFPKDLDIEVPYRTQASEMAPVEKPAENLLDESSGNTSFSPPKFDGLFDKGLLWAFILVFFAGLLTSFTPCVFPMIPITIAVLSRDAQKRTRLQSLALSLTYVLGIAITYALLGVVAASTGTLFGSLLSSTGFLVFMCAIFLAMAFSLFGFYEIQPPAFVRDHLSSKGQGGGAINAFISGVIAGVVASPCVGPVLVGILTYVAQSKDLFLGFWLLFVFALGMGMLFLVIGMSTQATKLLPRSGAWMDGVKNFSGILMLGVFYYYLSFLLELRWHDVALGLGLIILGSLGGAFAGAKTRFERIKKGLCWAFLLGGSALLVIGALDLRPVFSSRALSGAPAFTTNTLTWKPLTEAALKESAEKGRPVLIDFFAEWCAACHELEKLTFTNQRVQLLATQFDLLRFDATKESPELEAFREKFGIMGLPWVVFIDRTGNYQKELTLTGFEEAPPFIERMNRALKASP